MKNQFKVGDLVYYAECKKICKVVGVFCKNIVLDIGKIRVCIPRMSFFGMPAPIFHATAENHELLSKLYPNVEFEPPPKRKEPKEIIGLMKEAGHKFILCKAKDHNSDQWETVVAFGISSYCSPTSSSDYMHDSFGSSYFEFYPINSKGQKIIDFVDGEVVLEGENE